MVLSSRHTTWSFEICLYCEMITAIRLVPHIKPQDVWQHRKEGDPSGGTPWGWGSGRVHRQRPQLLRLLAWPRNQALSPSGSRPGLFPPPSQGVRSWKLQPRGKHWDSTPRKSLELVEEYCHELLGCWRAWRKPEKVPLTQLAFQPSQLAAETRGCLLEVLEVAS